MQESTAFLHGAYQCHPYTLLDTRHFPLKNRSPIVKHGGHWSYYSSFCRGLQRFESKWSAVCSSGDAYHQRCLRGLGHVGQWSWWSGTLDAVSHGVWVREKHPSLILHFGFAAWYVFSPEFGPRFTIKPWLPPFSGEHLGDRPPWSIATSFVV